jgi:[FeFe] hydrogenase H-cluster maturation GTPase HydF
MSLNDTPSGERIQIGFFGLVNVGKSSVVNAVTGQQLAVVSPVEGTTTDPVKKAMELAQAGPVVIIDTPGIGDTGILGTKRMEKTGEMLSRIHAAVLVTDCRRELNEEEQELLGQWKDRGLPYLIACNKADLLSVGERPDREGLYVSAKTGENIGALKDALASLAAGAKTKRPLVGDLLRAGDRVVLVIPIDKAAPQGRLILPQQQTLRDILDSGCIASVCRDTELRETLEGLREKPRLVITDSQVFDKVKEIVPEDVMLTSFSILFARYKGNLDQAVEGALFLEKLKEGDRILIAEGCTHHRQCGDIGTQKLPAWLEGFTGKRFVYEFTSGGEFPADLSGFALVIHCGGCMLNEKEMQHRLHQAREKGVAMTNYGTAIAHINGILRRSLEPFNKLT